MLLKNVKRNYNVIAVHKKINGNGFEKAYKNLKERTLRKSGESKSDKVCYFKKF